MTHKLLTPAEVAEMTARVSSSYAAIRKLDGACDSHIAEAHMRADIDALLSDRLARADQAMDFAKFVIDDLQRTGSVGPLATLHANFMLIQPPEKESGR